MTNVVLVSFDTTRADRLGCYGHRRRTSPHIDSVAAAGVRFSEHFSPHIPTYPGHTTLFTGTDLYDHRVTGQTGAFEPPTDIPMLAEILRGSGYFTGAADNLNRWFTRGFDAYEGYQWDTVVKHGWRRAEAVTETALRLLKTATRNPPFFLFLHYWDPHTPYLPPEPFHRMFYQADERDPDNRTMDALWEFEPFRHYFAEWMPGVTDIEFPKAQYDAEIAYMDASFAHVLEAMETLGVADDTLLVLTADHGEELDEHGHWFDHHGLYDTNLHIPLIMRWPAGLPAGVSVSGMTRSLDVAPTILDLVAANPIGGSRMTGTSLSPLVFHPGPVARGSTDVIHATENTWMKKRAIRTHTWKLIVPLEIPDLHGNSDVELYHLTTDPAERVNRAEELPEVVSLLNAQMRYWVDTRAAESGQPDPLLQQPIPLRSIGSARGVEAEQKNTGPRDESVTDGDFVGYDRERPGESG